MISMYSQLIIMLSAAQKKGKVTMGKLQQNTLVIYTTHCDVLVSVPVCVCVCVCVCGGGGGGGYW